jgi:hypothetical protein
MFSLGCHFPFAENSFFSLISSEEALFASPLFAFLLHFFAPFLAENGDWEKNR